MYSYAYTYARLSGLLKPCLTNLVFWGKDVLNSLYNSRLVNGLLYKAKINSSNCVYLNGTNTKMSITFANDLLLYFDRLTIKYSTDGTTLSTWTTGQATVAGLFRLNTATRLFEVGYDGTVYKAMYVDSIFVECNNSVTYIPILDFTLSSGSTIEDNSRAVNENELTGLFPLNLIRDNILDIDLSF